MIRAEWYKTYMKYADIPISVTEEEILDRMTDRRGMLDEKVFMNRLYKETSVPITQNQITIIEMLAWIEGAVKAMYKKNNGKVRHVKVSRKKADN